MAKMKKEVDKEEMKQCLIDAQIYEENLTDDLILEYYKAIKNSETSLHEESQKDIIITDEAEKSLNESANELLEAINNSESVAPSKKTRYISKSDDDDSSLDAFSQDIMLKPKLSKVVPEETNNNNNSIDIDGKQEKSQGNDVILDIKKTPIGFNDMPKTGRIEKDMLKIISHELKFINIQNSKKFLTSNSENRIKMLYNYHHAVAKLRAQYASLSTNMAPIGKPITAVDNDLCMNPVISNLKEEEIQLSSETAYVSRSGRLTKRKVYNDFDDGSQESFSSTSKKAKNDNDWHSKSTAPSTTTNKEKATKSTLKKYDSDEVIISSYIGPAEKPATGKPHTQVQKSESPDSSQDLKLTTFIDTFDEIKNTPPPIQPKPRTYQRKMPSNDEIVATNSLFKDFNTPKRGRTGAMLSAAREDSERKKKQEVEIIRFTDSLDLDSQTFDDESEKIIVDDDDDAFEKRRVPPPLPSSRKPIHARKRGGLSGPESLNISAKRVNLNASVEEVKSSAVNGHQNPVTRRNPVARRGANNNNSDRGEPSSSSSMPSTSRGGKKDVNMMPCPLCSMSFPKKEIEEHAATCGEDMFPQTSQPKRITCEVCDTVVPFTTDYEVHVKACIAKRNS